MSGHFSKGFLHPPICTSFPAHFTKVYWLPLQGGLEKKDITTLLMRAAELAVDAGQLPSDRYNDHAFVITAALQASSALVRVVDFLPVSLRVQAAGSSARVVASAGWCGGRRHTGVCCITAIAMESGQGLIHRHAPAAISSDVIMLLARPHPSFCLVEHCL